ncbi:MAG: AI-2E family transporter [Pseudomonadota bacterium]
MQLLREWFVRRFSNPQVFILLALVLLGFVAVWAFGNILAPLFAALVIAYLLEGVVIRLQDFGLPRLLVVSLVFVIFVATLLVMFFGIVPLLTRQVTQLVQQVPAFVNRLQTTIETLPEKYPELVSQEQITAFMGSLGDQLAEAGQGLVTQTLASISGVITLLVFLVLVPILVFFLLKDKHQLIAWFQQFLPKDRHLAISVWREVDVQLGNYVRGKAVEILVVGVVTFVTFQFLNLQYAALLATIVGFSVLVPYIGAAVVTLPVAIVAFYQFGWTSQFAWVLISYGIIQMLDGNALVPLLFSEVVDLHPVAIIAAVLLFGGVWGFWGVFFAIPLATLSSALLRAIRTGQIAASEAAEATSEALSTPEVESSAA